MFKSLADPETVDTAVAVTRAVVIPLIVFNSAAVVVPSLTVTSTSVLRFTLSPLVPSFPASVFKALDVPVTVPMFVAVTRPVVNPLIVAISVAATDPVSVTVIATPAARSTLSPLVPSFPASVVKSLTAPETVDTAVAVTSADVIPLIVFNCAAVVVPSLTVTRTSAFRSTAFPLLPSFPASVFKALDVPVTVAIFVAVTRFAVTPLIVVKSAAATEPVSETVIATSAFRSTLSPLVPSFPTSVVKSLTEPEIAATAVAFTRDEVALLNEFN